MYKIVKRYNYKEHHKRLIDIQNQIKGIDTGPKGNPIERFGNWLVRWGLKLELKSIMIKMKSGQYK